MNKNKLNHSDLLHHFFDGTTSENDYQELKNISAEEFDAFCKEIWKASSDSSMSEEHCHLMQMDIMNRIKEYEAENSRRKKLNFRRWFKSGVAVVSAAAVLVFAVFMGYHWSQKQNAPQQFELTCSNGQQSVLTLPDGTTVHLNASSKLTYNSSYNSRNRAVNLEGEAYFDVAHDEEHPFVVSAGEMSIKVLGTQFDVKAYPDDDEIVTTLVQGKIQADVNGQEEILLPRERLKLDKWSGRLTKTENVELNNLVPWIENKIYFEHNTLKEISVVLKRMYDVEVIFQDKSIEDFSYTGHIRNISLKNILELIAGTSPIGYKLDGQIVTFYLLK